MSFSKQKVIESQISTLSTIQFQYTKLSVKLNTQHTMFSTMTALKVDS